MELAIADKYYNREDIQKAILKFSADREIAIKYNTYFGKRPSIIEYSNDIKKILKQNPTSFHCSEERWLNPLLLEDKNLSEEDKRNNRIGWDLILDLDGVDFEYAKITGKIIIEFLQNDLNIKNVSTKFSGNKGFHIGIPFEAFSSNILGIGETKKLFPEIPRKIAIYLMEELKGKISSEILKTSGSIKEIASKYEIPISDLEINDEESNNLNYKKLIEIDTILITSRHLFRIPYSLNEKSGLASIPLKNEEILNFDKDSAKPNNVDPYKYKEFEFLKYNPNFGRDADILLIKAYEEVPDEALIEIDKKIKKEKIGEKKGIIFTGDSNGEIFEINSKVELKDFPEVIKFILENKFEDGKKRAMFVLLTFLYSIKYEPNSIDIIIKEWNTKQIDPLKENIVNAQLMWFRNQQKIISPPNYSNEEYYKSIGIPEEIIKKDQFKFKDYKIKNPLHHVFILLKQREFQKNLKKGNKKNNNNK